MLWIKSANPVAFGAAAPNPAKPFEKGLSESFNIIERKERSELRQYRIIIVVRLRSQIFRQIVQKRRRRADARQGVFVQDGGKSASKRAAKAAAVNCAVLP